MSHQEETETIDLTENINYQVLSAFFENDNGHNITDVLSSICNAINNNTDAILALKNKIEEFQVEEEEEEDDEDDDLQVDEYN
jgi:hypothetical protein